MTSEIITKSCTFPGCPHEAKRALCRGHRRQQREGEKLRPIRLVLRGPLKDRLAARSTEMPNGCREWIAAKNDVGYGQISFNGKKVYAHRAAYEIAHGPIPAGLVIDHICHNRACINVSHLQAVTQRENVQNHNGRPKSHNKSGVRGVRWHKTARAWEARVGYSYRQISVGFFDSLAEAERAVIKARNEIHSNNLKDRK